MKRPIRKYALLDLKMTLFYHCLRIEFVKIKLHFLLVLLVVFSACGGREIHTCKKGIPVLSAYFPVLAYGKLGMGGLVVVTTIGDCHTRLMVSSTQAEACCTDLQLIRSSVADYPTLT